jgi:hypothetical protein
MRTAQQKTPATGTIVAGVFRLKSDNCSGKVGFVLGVWAEKLKNTTKKHHKPPPC